MEKLGIVLDFKAKSITIDEIILPMRNINSLTDKSPYRSTYSWRNIKDIS